MSEKLLERLQIKKNPTKKQNITIVLPGTKKFLPDEIDTLKKNFKSTMFLDKLKITKRNVELSIKQPTISVTDKKAPKKVKKLGKIKLKFVDKFTDKKLDDKQEKKVKEIKEPEDIKLSVPAESIIIKNEEIKERLPNRKPSINIKAPSYYMNNREIFVNFINSILKPYRDKIINDKTKITCDMIKNNKKQDFSLLIHQLIVRDYINLVTPYRGLLLYHGLGAGKTCGSIGIAEGMKSEKKIFVMAPASLIMNYKMELRKCGDPLYKTNQYWEFINTENNEHQIKALADVLSLTTQFIRKNKGVWLVDSRKKPNYENLNNVQRTQINTQIEKMISRKYEFLAYNGMNKSKLAALELQAVSKGKNNPFTNSVVVIDEAHNFVSRIVNKLKQPKSISMKLYDYLMDAENCKIVFLTGTPIINYPNEIAILFNMLRGYIKTYYFTTVQKVDKEKIKNILKAYSSIDYVNYNVNKKQLIITRNPFNFVNRRSKQVYAGVSKNPKAKDTEEVFIKKIIALLKKNNIQTDKNTLVIQKHTALPDNLITFNNQFVNLESGDLKNENLFKKRILGLTSYFRSAQESLLPEYNSAKDMKIVELPMSDYQLKIYELGRQAERSENRNKPKKGDDGLYKDVASTYRIASRVFCNFVFPKEIERPAPDNNKKFLEIVKTSKKNNVDEDDIDNASVKDKLNNLDGRFTNDDKEQMEEKTVSDHTYKERIKLAIQKLKDGVIDENTQKRKLFLKGENLKELSPKFYNILSKLQDPDYYGLHLLYSQFRTMEGIGIFKATLELNGYTQFKIKKDNNGLWRLNIRRENLPKQKFCLYTGEESAEEKEIIRNIFNSNWDKIPISLKTELNKISPHNYHGEIIQLIMITSSGAEGITLENVRFVHILEPYWHPVRSEQVIGRAVRICSHKNLDKKYRNVKVFQYIMRLTDHQINGNPNSKDPKKREPQITGDMRKNDRSKYNPSEIFTTDQALHEISNRKETINKNILMAIKESAFDCALHKKPGNKEQVKCYTNSTKNRETFSTTPDITKEESDTVSKLNKPKRKWKGVAFNWRGKKMVLKRDNPNDPNTKTGDVYDYNSYIMNDLVKVGRLEIDPKNTKKLILVQI